MWERTSCLFFLVWLTSLTLMIPSFIYSPCKQHSWVLLHGWTISIVCIYNMFFLIHSSVDGHRGWFYNLTVVNSAAIYDCAGISILLWFTFLQVYTWVV
jgi:hypothetical protein